MNAWTLPAQDCGVLPEVHPTAFWVRVQGRVRSKSNYRNGAGSTARSAWKAVHDYEQGLSLAVRAARPTGWLVADMAVPVAARPVTVAAILARSTLDTGNVSKSILDACQSILVGNDAEFKAVLEAVERTRSDQGVVVAFMQLPAGSSLAQAVRAASSLAQALTELPSS